MQQRVRLILSVVVILLLLVNCGYKKEKKELNFTEVKVSSNAQLWWARSLADINNDEIADIVLINNNGAGGWLGWLEGTKDTTKEWTVHIIADSLQDGRKFASGDLEVGDFDNDGDIDVIGVVHPGEWTDAKAQAELFWYENPTWEQHRIGVIPNALKDINIADLNNDSRLDIVTMNFEENYLTIFIQQNDGSFKKDWQEQIENLHEGMDIADLNGDNFTDIAANGYWFKNPGLNKSLNWEVLVIDTIWNNQIGDWSRNATKVACYDFDGNGKSEVLISHSERDGYPVAMYSLVSEKENKWEKEILLKNLTAAHNLRIEDFDLDEKPEILTGVNKHRAMNININDHPVYILSNKNGQWDSLRISSDGIYNAQTVDFDNDGDIDIFRYPTHDVTDFYLMINNVIK